MAEQKPNTTCRICGKIYYSCKTCKDVNHWKAVACCPEHFIQYVNLVTESREQKEFVENNADEVIEKVAVEATNNIVAENAIATKSKRKISEKSR